MRASNEINEIKILFIVELRAIYLTLSCSSDHACYQSAFPDVHPKVLPLSSTSRNRSRNRSPQWQGWRCAPSPPELGYSSTLPPPFRTLFTHWRCSVGPSTFVRMSAICCLVGM